MAELPILPVSIFTQLVADHLAVLGEVVVEGEISQMQISQGRWLFLTLKDAQASISVFAPVFKITSVASLTEGMSVQVYGTAGLYQKTGRFSLNAYRIVPAGDGALRQAYERLKAKLQAEGLFDPGRKRPLPRLPQRIGLITAADSRAYSDFVKVLSERLGGLTIEFYPVQVQGKAAVPSILQAFHYFNQMTHPPEILVLTRGGGSLEDLLSFNDEAVARAVFSSQIPVVSAIGHEEDVALTDFVADLRASTPSNAAELLVPSRRELLTTLHHLTLQLETSLIGELHDQQRLVSHYAQRLGGVLDRQQHRWQTLADRLNQQVYGLRQKLSLRAQRSQFMAERLLQALQQKLLQQTQQLTQLERLLENLDPRKVLARGFSITRTKAGVLVTSTVQVKPGTQLITTLAEGELSSLAT